MKFSNIWNHPKTSAAGLLLAVVTVAGVLSGQGVTLGHAGTGTVVALVAAICTALLGLLARDPSDPPAGGTGSPVSKLGVVMLCMLLVSGLFASGCSGTAVAQDIVNWTPTLQSAVTAVDATVSVLDPAGAPIFAVATVGFDAASNVLVAQAKAYLANSSAPVLQQLQTAVVTFQQQVNAALLSAAHITNPASQQKALADINGVGTIINTILSLVVSISGKAAVARMAQESPIKLAMLPAPRDDLWAVAMVAAHYREPLLMASVQVSAGQVELEQSGF